MHKNFFSKIHDAHQKHLQELQLKLVRNLRGKSGKSFINLQITEIFVPTGDGAA